MLNKNQLELIPDRIYQRLNNINTEYLVSIGEVLKDIGELRPTDIHQLQQMYNFGSQTDKMARMLSEATQKNTEDIYKLFDAVAKDNYTFAKPFYEAKLMDYIPYEENIPLQRKVRAMAKQTVDEYVNLSQHTAFAVFSKDGKSIAPYFAANKDKIVTPASEVYTKISDYAITQVQLGMESYNKAVTDIIKTMSASGIRTVDYAKKEGEKGYSRRLDTAVRQNVLWAVKECNQQTANLVGEEFGADGMEVDYHMHPRPSHADMGGRQYALGQTRTVKGVHYPSFEEKAKPLLEEYGCLHFAFPIILGVSRPAYTEEELQQFKIDDNKTFEFEGEKYTMYDGIQLQRKIETKLRHQRDILNMAKAAGDGDTELIARGKIRMISDKYAELSNVSGLPTQMERTRSAIAVKSVDKSRESGIIKSQGDKIMNINNIDSPIEKRNTGKGNPNAILTFGRPLNTRQSKLLNSLSEYDSRIVVPKKTVNMRDLSALTAHTGVEYALFTKGNERLVIRGNVNSVNIDVQQAVELSKQGYKWSGHTHPGIGMNCLQASPGDREILGCFKQKVAYIYNSQGDYLEFWKE